jgi:hypothetical protein
MNKRFTLQAAARLNHFHTSALCINSLVFIILKYVDISCATTALRSKSGL